MTEPSTSNFGLLPAKLPSPIVYNWPDYSRDRVVTIRRPQGILEVTYAYRIIYR